MAETMTLVVPDAVARVLQSKAALRGEKVERIAGELLIAGVENETALFDPETLTAIHEGIADGEAGREQPFDDYLAEMKARRAARKPLAPSELYETKYRLS